MPYCSKLEGDGVTNLFGFSIYCIPTKQSQETLTIKKNVTKIKIPLKQQQLLNKVVYTIEKIKSYCTGYYLVKSQTTVCNRQCQKSSFIAEYLFVRTRKGQIKDGKFSFSDVTLFSQNVTRASDSYL